MLEFHISRHSRDLYQLDDTLFTLRGNVVFANFQASRRLAQKMNLRKNRAGETEEIITAGQLNAMGLIDEILHVVIQQYRQQVNPNISQHALAWLEASIGKPAVDMTLRQFAQEFPNSPVYREEILLETYWVGETEGIPNREILLEELLMLWVDNENPAFQVGKELFDHKNIRLQTKYDDLLSSLYEFFDSQPSFGPDQENLIDMLHRPALVSPDSLAGQLAFLNQNWFNLIGSLVYRLLNSMDLIKEETKPVFTGPGPIHIPEFKEQVIEPENFSQDLDWMPHLVLIAKNSYVWLDQLSKQYQLPIRRLDEIPEEELDKLAKWGINGLWMIGIWERSSASQRIKQMRGNPEAVASAYSLYDYQIAEKLGGENAYQQLRTKAWQRGIRLSADMVPNHVGIDGRWVIEHPDWFVSLNYSPFPTYTFNGPDLSSDRRVGIYLEDHYYTNSDAAVVFKRVDHWTGDEKYIYHGNDGTSMPWNDTAQLNYLNPQLREAVIQTILHVARKFPVIRFDAAMTLSKKHFHRLWFPEPGSGGDIPSRSEFGLTQNDFDQAMPEEFWREVVDRVAQEVPDTLLLAEAFWLMEGYFVRTLGMHRVYNSAFMNLLRDEKNEEFRKVIKNTLEFDPEILKRYVNFMNNPDEETAVEQFGKGDKYFGICTMLVTLPGLPMFGHGQLEGFSEKYGMEYQKAYWDETVDQTLVKRHEKEIFPLLHKRFLFAEVQNFLLYDFYSEHGLVNEDVFAYSNRFENQISLVIYHNRYAETSGWIKTSSAFSKKSGDGSSSLTQADLADGLTLKPEAGLFTIFQDHITGLEYIRSSQELAQNGLFVELKAYQYYVFTEFRQVADTDWGSYQKLNSFLNGKGVDDIEEAMQELLLQPLHLPFKELMNPGMFRWIVSERVQEKAPPDQYLTVLDEVKLKMLRWVEEFDNLSGDNKTDPALVDVVVQKLSILLRWQLLQQIWKSNNDVSPSLVDPFHQTGEFSLYEMMADGNLNTWGVLLSWLYIQPIDHPLPSLPDSKENQKPLWFDKLLLAKATRTTLIESGIDGFTASRMLNLVRILLEQSGWWTIVDEVSPQDLNQIPSLLMKTWLDNHFIQVYIGINQYNDIAWFNKEAFEELISWFNLVAEIEILHNSFDDFDQNNLPDSAIQQISTCNLIINKIKTAGENSRYQVEQLLEELDFS